MGGMISVLRIPLASRRVSPALILSPQLMSLPSPAWPQQDEPPPCGTATSLPPPSSDSDSGCALEEYPEPPADPAPPEVGSTPGSLCSLLSPSSAGAVHGWYLRQSPPRPQDETLFSNLKPCTLIPLKSACVSLSLVTSQGPAVLWPPLATACLSR